MAEIIYTPIPPPPIPADYTRADDLSPKQEELLKAVLAHFSTAEYVIPGLDTEKCTLTEDEKFWLVSSLSYTPPYNEPSSFFPFSFSRMNVCLG